MILPLLPKFFSESEDFNLSTTDRKLQAACLDEKAFPRLIFPINGFDNGASKVPG